jgi:hypothetical protein
LERVGPPRGGWSAHGGALGEEEGREEEECEEAEGEACWTGQRRWGRRRLNESGSRRAPEIVGLARMGGERMTR